MSMTSHHDILFNIVNTLVLPGWALLVFAPRWEWTRRLIYPGYIPFVICILYGIFLFKGLMSGTPGGFGSLDQLAALSASKDWVLAGWVHYLAFDLFIGTWIVRDTETSAVPHGLVIPCLLLTFIAGPVGLGLYLTLRLKFR